MKKDNLVYLGHILDYIEKIEKHASGLSEEEFIHNSLYHLAIIRCFEVIGEASKRLTPEFKKKHDLVIWKQVAGFRDVLIHNYDGVSLRTVWKAVQVDVPKLKTQLLAILNTEEPNA